MGDVVDDDGERRGCALRDTAIALAMELSKAWGQIRVIDEPSRGAKQLVGYAEEGRFVWELKVKQPYQ